MISRVKVILLVMLVLVACSEGEPGALGQLESDRIELVADTSEPIVEILVKEGDQLSSGQILVRQDSSRIDSRILEAKANTARIEAILAEQINGPRQQTIAAAKASLTGAKVERKFSTREVERLTELRERNLTSIESIDQAEKLLESSEAKIKFSQARLDELEAGTRPEQIEQTQQRLLQARAQLASLEIDKQRLFIISPMDTIVDSLPFEVGERPKAGDVIAVLLMGTQPYARIYVPEQHRVNLAPGDTVQILIDGVEESLQGSVRRIASEASFTPYFALTENDRGRLSYVAEIRLPELPARLPDGIPVEALFSVAVENGSADNE